MGQSEADMDSFLHRFHEVTVLVELYYTPVLCLLGFIGNSLSILVFLMDSQYRRLSASYYLSALALSDNGYLINLFAVWLESVRELVITSDITCPLVMYLGQVTCFLSIYLIVAFSVERFVAVHYPLSRPQICTRSKARKIIAVLTVLALILFSYVWIIAQVVELDPLLSFSSDEYENQDFGLATNKTYYNGSIPVNEKMEVVMYRCSVPEMYYHISEIANYLDTCITLVIPFILITFFNGCIAWSLWKLKDTRRVMVATRAHNSPTSLSSSLNGSFRRSRASIRHCHSRVLTCTGGFRENEEREVRGATVRKTCATTTVKIDDDDKDDNLEMTEVTGTINAAADAKIRVDDGEEEENEIDCVSPKDMKVEDRVQNSIVNQSGIRLVPSNTRPKPSQILILSTCSDIRVTKTLLLVSFVFLILNLPLHAIRCTQFIQTLTAKTTSTSSVVSVEQEESNSDDTLLVPTAQLWANMLFNTNFAVNFLLFCANGKNFKSKLRKIIIHRILRITDPIQTSTFVFQSNPNIVRQQ